MAESPDHSLEDGSKQPTDRDKQPCPTNIWHNDAIIKMKKDFRDGLYPVYHQLDANVRKGLGLMMRVPVFLKDPLIAIQDPAVGIQDIEVRLEENMGSGPTSSRLVVVDMDPTTKTTMDPVIWVDKEGWFCTPHSTSDWLPVKPNLSDGTPKDPEKNMERCQEFIKKAVENPYFHQVNVWAVVQWILEFYEGPWALGRPIPWSFDGNRLKIIPHAGHGKNSEYNAQKRSLMFYTYGDEQHPHYTCLSHDIVAHEAGHAVLDGIRPLYLEVNSVETAAFHEFFADMTAILLPLFNPDIRKFINKTADGLKSAHVLADLARELAEEVGGGAYLRSAFNQLTMLDVKDELDPHTVSQVLTGAIWDILCMIADKHLMKNLEGKKVSPANALWWAATRIRQVAIQPLDLCPPSDITFIDYARAVVRNDILTNPRDEQGYRNAILEVFHKRKICECSYRPEEEMPSDCMFKDVMHQERINFVYHDIEHVSRSRTAAYYFLDDNRRILHIPLHQDVRVVDLYEVNKYGVAAERLPREIIIEYAWWETVELKNDPQEDLDYGAMNGKRVKLRCGGTLVFDGRGNLLSWSHKPGTDHVTKEEVERIRIEKDPSDLEVSLLEDLREGKKRIMDMCKYINTTNRRCFIVQLRSGDDVSEATRPIVAIEDRGVLRFEMTPHMRSIDLNKWERDNRQMDLELNERPKDRDRSTDWT